MTKGFLWLRDALQVLALDRLNPATRPFSHEASAAVQTLRFHAHARMPRVELAEILSRLSPREPDSVVLPAGNGLGSQAYYMTLASIVAALKPETILEFGTYLGMGALTMALNASGSCKIFTLDLPDEAPEEARSTLNALDRGHVASSRNRVGEAFLQHRMRDRITQLRADSMTFRAADHVRDADLVLVDGGHSLPLIKKDTGNAFDVLSARGVILWDDYFQLYPEVVSFLDELSRKYPLRSIAGTNCVIYSRT